MMKGEKIPGSVPGQLELKERQTERTYKGENRYAGYISRRERF